VDGRHHWRTSYKARAAVVGVTAVGLALYGLLGGGAKSAVVPFQGKSVSTVATDKFAAAATGESGASASGAGNIDVVTLGPSHSLYFYWQTAGTWYGPIQAGGPGTAYSGPAIAAEFAGTPDHLDVAVEGPGHSLNFFWKTAGVWYGPLQIGAPGSTCSPPKVTFDSDGNVDVAAQGPNGTIYEYWGVGGSWNGPLQVAGKGTSFTTPTIASSSTTSGGGGTCHNNWVTIQSEGSANQAIEYEHLNNRSTGSPGCTPVVNQWVAPSTSGQNQQYSASNSFQFGSAWLAGYQGPGNSNIFQFSPGQGGSNFYCVLSGAGTDFAAPGMAGIATTTSSFAVNVAQQGPSNSLYAFWFTTPAQPTTCPAFYGPLQLGAANTAFSIPAVASVLDSTPNFVTDTLVEGPSHTLWVYWSSGGAWNGPVQIGGPGTTFDTSS
jgi:hypothetical protein